ncbi:MAG: hypothetical protein PHH37_12835 [Paludibacter sp.]|nr:hypothetical protein [Paludibacter sp.]
MKYILFIMLLFTQTVFSQKGLYSRIESDFPSVDLNNSSVVSQLIRLGLGYSFTENIGTSLNIGSGLLGKNAIQLSGTNKYFSFGISADYMPLKFKNKYKLGIEALSDYNIIFVDNNDDDHLSITGALKLQLPSKTYLRIGLQNRFMQNRAALLVCTFGYRLH